MQEELDPLCEVMGSEDVVSMLVSCELVLDLGEDTVNTEWHKLPAWTEVERNTYMPEWINNVTIELFSLKVSNKYVYFTLTLSHLYRAL